MARYVENEKFTPNPTDMRGTFQTTRTGVPQNPDAASEVFRQDRHAAAERMKEAAENDGDILYAGDAPSREEQKEAVVKRAERALKGGEPKPGGPTKAQQEAAQENDNDTSNATSATEQPDISDATTQQNTDAQTVADASVKHEDAPKSSTRRRSSSK